MSPKKELLWGLWVNPKPQPKTSIALLNPKLCLPSGIGLDPAAPAMDKKKLLEAGSRSLT